MKGIVFTEFLEMVEGKFSPELADSHHRRGRTSFRWRIHNCWNLRSQ